MNVLAFALPILLSQSPVSDPARVASTLPAASCRDWHECRRLALDAAERRDYETFHDLAWRSAQTGPPRDPDLMYLLARAQCLSGRPHDALIMLRRLAEMGVASDAATNDDFQRTRALPGWPEVKALIERLRNEDLNRGSAVAPSSSPSPAPAPTPPTLPPAVSRGDAPLTAPSPTTSVSAAVARRSATELAVFKPQPVEQAARIPAARFTAGGLAYDAVSRRFVVGDLHGRKLIVVDDGSDHPVDLVRSDSAGFHEIRAVEIDDRRGDLWVATATGTAGDWTLHRMQLVSGRPLKIFHSAPELEPMNVIDLAVSPAGAVLALDAIGSRLVVLRPGGTGLNAGRRMALHEPRSVAATGDESIAYVAHRAGVSRVNLKTGTAVVVAVPKGLDFGLVERIRWHRNALIAVQINENGSRRIVRFELNTAGRAVTGATIIDTSIPAGAGPIFATVSGDELCYLVADPDASLQSPQEQSPGGLSEFIVRRIRLR